MPSLLVWFHKSFVVISSLLVRLQDTLKDFLNYININFPKYLKWRNGMFSYNPIKVRCEQI